MLSPKNYFLLLKAPEVEQIRDLPGVWPYTAAEGWVAHGARWGSRLDRSCQVFFERSLVSFIGEFGSSALPTSGTKNHEKQRCSSQENFQKWFKK